MLNFIYNKKYILYTIEEEPNDKLHCKTVKRITLTTKSQDEAVKIAKSTNKKNAPIVTLYQVKTYFCKICFKQILFTRIKDIEEYC